MLIDVIGFILSGVMLIFLVSFALLGYALMKNKADLISLSRRAMIISFVAFAVAVTGLQIIFNY